MFFLSLALIGQSATLDADIGKAARKCVATYVSAVSDPDESQRLSVLSQIIYLGMSVSRTEGRVGKAFMDRALDVLDEAKTEMDKGGATPALAAECDKRFPLARATALPRLPQAQADRDILCTASISLLANMAHNMPDTEEDLLVLQGRFAGRYETAMKSKASGTKQEEKVLGDALRASLDIGNPESIAFSCKNLPD